MKPLVAREAVVNLCGVQSSPGASVFLLEVRLRFDSLFIGLNQKWQEGGRDREHTDG